MTKDTTEGVSIPCSAHGRKRHRLRLALHCVEVALLQMVRHAGEVRETPRHHWVEGSAESPHLRRQVKTKKLEGGCSMLQICRFKD